VLRRADRLIATSAAYIESSRYLSRLREKCTVVPIGADLERFDRVDPARLESLGQRFFTPSDHQPKLVFVGVSATIKDWATFCTRCRKFPRRACSSWAMARCASRGTNDA